MRCLFQRLRHDEAGFSLPELLTAMVIGGVVLAALMTLMTTGFLKSAQVTDRAEAAQIGRSAMDRTVTLLDSTVCLDPSSAGIIPPLIGAAGSEAGSDSNYLAFYADLNGVSGSPDKYTITYDATAKSLTERRYQGIGSLPNLTFPASATETRVLATNVVPARDPNTTAQLPIFRYYDYEADGTINTGTPLAVPITAVIAPTVVRVLIDFQSISSRTKTEDKRSTMIEGQSAIGTPDPATPNAGSCP